MRFGKLGGHSATTKQEEYIEGMLQVRAMPEELRERAEGCLLKGLLADEADELIPELKIYPFIEDVRASNYDHDWGDYEDWRDHPDAVFGDPNEHGSH